MFKPLKLMISEKKLQFFYLVFLLAFSQIAVAQTGISDNFNDNVLAAGWIPDDQHKLTEENSELKIEISKSGYQNFEFHFETIDLSSNPVLTIKAKSSETTYLRLDLGDESGLYTNSQPIEHPVEAGDYQELEYDFSGRFGSVDASKIDKVVFMFNPGSNYSNSVIIDDFALGTGGPTNGGGGGSPVQLSQQISLNQIGFYPEKPKVAAVKDAPANQFHITLPDATDTLYTGTLSPSQIWEYSNENVQIADFSDFTTPGEYIVVVPSVGRSYPFEIKENVHGPVLQGLIKSYYYQRASTEITSEYAGKWARPFAHGDENVQVHWSAETDLRPEGYTFASPKGWYDAGDYGKYIVNAAVATHNLLSSYEYFSTLHDTLSLNIPESSNEIPDVLDEAKWSLDWMLTMQGPEGEVYHKLTEGGFEGTVMPQDANGTRLAIGISTEATLDFAAVMAQAARIFEHYEEEYPGFSEQCLTASENAFNWAKNNPDQQFTGNPDGVNTGEYKNSDIDKCFKWAAMELYITTQDDSYYLNNEVLNDNFTLPRWDTVSTFGLVSLAANYNNLTPAADYSAIKSELQSLADAYTNYSQTSAYRTTMGTLPWDFSWGSNSFCANEGVVLLAAYRITGNPDYLNAAISSLDYLLGRNATNYSFVTGFGDKTPQNIHHRASYADGVADPVPGLVAGGPQNDDNQGDCDYPSNYPATKYLDEWCSYSTNEIAINWNAPTAFLAAGVEYFTNPNEDIVTSVPSYPNSAKAGSSLVSVYPNPSVGTYNITLHSTQGPATVTVTDAAGNEITEEVISGPGGSVNLENRPQGIYFAKVLINGQQEVLKLIKK